MNFCIWQWNLAITYPQHDRHTGDDDVQCAFPRLKYNPQLVGMHSSISNKTLMMRTGLTFGDNTSPSTFEPVARARQKLAQHLWHQPELIFEKAGPYLPQFKFAPPATEAERAAFAVAIPDSLNVGVLDHNGRRRAPTYDHHVDDNMYRDITELIPRAAAASVVALYEILGYPDGRTPDRISWEKFATIHGHLRRVLGWEFDTRSLAFALPADKRKALAELLSTWLKKLVVQSWRPQSCTDHCQMRPRPTGKAEQCFLDSRTQCGEQSKPAIIKSRAFTAANPNSNTCRPNSRKISTTVWIP